MADKKNPVPGAELPHEIKDDNTGMVAKMSGYLEVGRLPTYRAVAVNFKDHGAIYYMSPLMARRLAQELLKEADALTQ